jgi:predicted nucleic acid-binding protein
LISRRIVADTGPLNYLVLIGAEAILPQLFGAVVVPSAVLEELLDPAAPAPVRDWAGTPPDWLEVVPDRQDRIQETGRLDRGEAAAIALALALRADALLVDDRAGAKIANALGLMTVGTVGLLDRAAARGLIALEQTIARLRATNFRVRPELLDALVERHRKP